MKCFLERISDNFSGALPGTLSRQLGFFLANRPGKLRSRQMESTVNHRATANYGRWLLKSELELAPRAARAPAFREAVLPRPWWSLEMIHP